MSQADRFQAFAALHKPGAPLILYNVWDAGSARAVAEAGAPALATGSWSVAAAQGFSDAESLPLDMAIANAERVVRAVDVPVSIDFEGGYAVEPERLAVNLERLAGTGAVGCNFEDQVIGAEGIHPIALQCERIRAARAAVGPDFF
ncbi:MAG TPA: isocitrate lyase/phosphoenolpyruvate mutase family protein, partial [Allosphingosinicella sp.]|nr:isocitrate lyase/phosphoenolpyruvate mutase family protein [Allosphingosinicella sp.]